MRQQYDWNSAHQISAGRTQVRTLTRTMTTATWRYMGALRSTMCGAVYCPVLGGGLWIVPLADSDPQQLESLQTVHGLLVIDMLHIRNKIQLYKIPQMSFGLRHMLELVTA